MKFPETISEKVKADVLEFQRKQYNSKYVQFVKQFRDGGLSKKEAKKAAKNLIREKTTA